MEKNTPLKICNTTILPSEKVTVALPTPELYTCIPMHIPIHVIHGKYKGPILIISGAIYGDEVNGIAIIQKLLNLNFSKKLHGTIISIPAVNVYGLLSHTRNLPDNRDLKNSFPGSQTGTFASRLAYLLNTEIFSLGTHFIDIYSGDLHQNTVPHVITNTNSEECLALAKAFQTKAVIHSKTTDIMHRDGTKPTLIYKSGEAWRIDENNVKHGVNGILHVMRFLKMLTSKSKAKKSLVSQVLKETFWIRSPGSGMNEMLKKTGAIVKKNEHLANISDPFGTKQKYKILSPCDGIIVSINNFPLLNEGDYLIELASNVNNAQNLSLESSEIIEV